MIKRAMKSWNQSRQRKKLPDVMLHIGAPKCGSSAIQRFCVTQRTELLNCGIYYPEHSLDVNGVSGGHTQVAGALVNKKKDQANSTFQRWLDEARAKHACLLISAEALYGQFEPMAQFCQGLDVRVIGFLRHPVEYLLGNHNQGIKRHMSTQRLEALLPEFLGRSTAHLSGGPLLQWADLFGDEACTFIPYRSPSSGGSPIEESFLRALGLEGKLAALLEHLGPQTNRSYVKSALEIKRLLNIVLVDLPDQSAHRIDWCLQGYSDRTQNERGYAMHDLSAEVRNKLEQHLLKQMTPVVERFPQLRAVSEMPDAEAQSGADTWLDLGAPLNALQAEVPDVMEDIYQHATKLRDQGRSGYAFCKLLDLLGIEFQEPPDAKELSGWTDQQRKVLGNAKIREPDCLREMAVLLERQGLLQDALFTITRALDRRPTGTGIQRIKARIEDKLEIAERNSSLLKNQRIVSKP